jgi:hypothetical protein
MITINSICGEVWQGTEIKSLNNLPKSVLLHKYIIDSECTTFAVYIHFKKSGKKVYIRKTI